MAVQKLSLLIDESTDKGSTKHLAIVARMVDNFNLKVKDEFVSLIPVSNATAQNIFDVLIYFFNTNNIPYKTNLIGFASDGANTMFDRKHSVKKLLENVIKDLFVMKCMCHSLTLCASYSC